MTFVRRRILVRGVVQGVGFRPFVWQLAHVNKCHGWVRNSSSGVEIELQGAATSIDAVVRTIQSQPPPLAHIDSIAQENIPTLATEVQFSILDSQLADHPATFVSPDMATCSECIRELSDPQDRRFGYPFINCTHCGPRFTIQKSVPYDRCETTMSSFAMCEQCRAEFESPANRRFHAQATCCRTCGPTAWYVRSDQLAHAGSGNSQATRPSIAADFNTVIKWVRADIERGLIVAIKGIGGFHLACDARQSSAVQRLRARKHRPFKPLAVMAADIETASAIVELSPSECELLQSPQRPIVLARKRERNGLAVELAPRNPYLGVLLPYSPMHRLLLNEADVWVMTSGNLADEPIAYENADACERLSGIADAFLLHDRPIYTVCDDSVLRMSAVGPIPIRRSRGYAPLPIALPNALLSAELVPEDAGGSTWLAVGAELKNTLCLVSDNQAYLSQHIGDMGNRTTLIAVERSVRHLRQLYRSEPTGYVCDQHPGYMSTEYARRLADANQRPCVQVQHHHAHAAALIAEHGLSIDDRILVCVLDGTGFGTDGTIWGGEILIASARSFERVAHLQLAPLPGGDQCILHPARTALAYLHAVGLPWSQDLPSVQAHSAAELKLLLRQLEQRVNVVSTSSMGRLFDAVASLIGVCHAIDYEGQAAMELEFLAESIQPSAQAESGYPIRWCDHDLIKEPQDLGHAVGPRLLSELGTHRPSQLELGAVLSEICEDMSRRVSPAVIAWQFHHTIAKAFAQKCQQLRATCSPGQAWNTVGLTGGVFQNALLLRLMYAALSELGFRVLIHRVVPPNDGGLCLGQALVATATQG